MTLLLILSVLLGGLLFLWNKGLYPDSAWSGISISQCGCNSQGEGCEPQYRAEPVCGQSLFDVSPDPMAVLSESGIYLVCNQAFAHLLGGEHCTTAHICGTSASSWRNSEDRVIFHDGQQSQRLQCGVSVSHEEAFTGPNDSVQWFEITQSLHHDPKSKNDKILIVGRNITERKHLEQQLTDAIHELHTLSYFDYVTHIANRRHFDDKLQQQWRTHQRYHHSLALLLIDIDHFKAYNDHYGHQQGDKGLQAFAQVLTDSLFRPQDLVARYGGEEFVILLPETDEYGAQKVADRIQMHLQQAGIPHIEMGINGYLTCSIGIAALQPSLEMDSCELIQLADKALYQAKAQGRNQHCVSSQMINSVQMKS